MNVKELRKELKPLKKDCADYPVYVKINGLFYEVTHAIEDEVLLEDGCDQMFVRLETRAVL